LEKRALIAAINAISYRIFAGFFDLLLATRTFLVGQIAHII